MISQDNITWTVAQAKVIFIFVLQTERNAFDPDFFFFITHINKTKNQGCIKLPLT